MLRRITTLGLAGLMLAGSLAAASPASAVPGNDPGPSKSRSQCNLVPGRTTITITSGGRERTVVVHVPWTGENARALPLVLDLHGSNSTPTEELMRTKLDQTAQREGFIIAAPQGAIPAPAGFVWNVPHTGTDVAGAPMTSPSCKTSSELLLTVVVWTEAGRTPQGIRAADAWCPSSPANIRNSLQRSPLSQVCGQEPRSRWRVASSPFLPPVHPARAFG